MERGGRRTAALTAHKNDELARALAEMRRLERLIEQGEADLEELRAGSPPLGDEGALSYGQLEEARLLAERDAERTERLTARLVELRGEHRGVLERISGIQKMLQRIEEKDWDQP